MLKRYKINDFGQTLLRIGPKDRQKLGDRHIISEHNGSFYIVKGCPDRFITVVIKSDSILHDLEITSKGLVFAHFINGPRGSRYAMPVGYNPKLARDLFATYDYKERVYADYKNMTIKVKDRPNFIQVLLNKVGYRDVSIKMDIEEWEDSVKLLQDLEGIRRVWM